MFCGLPFEKKAESKAMTMRLFVFLSLSLLPRPMIDHGVGKQAKKHATSFVISQPNQSEPRKPSSLSFGFSLNGFLGRNTKPSQTAPISKGLPSPIFFSQVVFQWLNLSWGPYFTVQNFFFHSISFIEAYGDHVLEECSIGIGISIIWDDSRLFPHIFV